MKNDLFLSQWLRPARRKITNDIQTSLRNTKFVALRSLSLQNRAWFREIFYAARTGEILNLYALVSPTYTNNQWLSSDTDYFTKSSNWLEGRVARKFSATTEAINFLSQYFSLQVAIVIVDAWLLLSQEYQDIEKLKMSLQEVARLYQNRAELVLWTAVDVTFMSNLLEDGVPTVCDMSTTPSREQCVKIINENAINPEAIVKNLDVMIQAFWITVTYFELQAYFRESRLLGEKIGRSIILNVEGTTVWNTLLTKWKWNLTIDRTWDEVDRVKRKWWNLLVGWVVALT